MCDMKNQAEKAKGSCVNIVMQSGLIVSSCFYLASTLEVPGATLNVAAVSAGTARLDNGSVVNIGQPFIGVFGDRQSGILGSAGAVGALRRATSPSQLPIFNAPSWNTNGGIRLSFHASPGWNYTIEASTNLINWSSVWTTKALDDNVTFEDLDPLPYGQRFYRVGTY
ncbi:MAG: hypothetical protein JWM16_4241 [Verrucomicrobiales bacterium]|nr:hypothetical protein [Verrucomicrobiales bacterium]